MLTKEDQEKIKELESKIWEYDTQINFLQSKKNTNYDLKRQTEEELQRFKVKEKLLKYANCNHNFNKIEHNNYCDFQWCKKSYRYEIELHHDHETCNICGLVKDEPIYYIK
jgi:murein tripeptide amidase MpaA